MPGVKVPWFSNGASSRTYTPISESELSDVEKESFGISASSRRSSVLHTIFSFLSGVAITSLIFFLFSPRHPSQSASSSATPKSNKDEGQLSDPFPYSTRSALNSNFHRPKLLATNSILPQSPGQQRPSNPTRPSPPAPTLSQT